MLSRLDFIVRFAETDFDKLDAGEWVSLKDQVAAFTSMDRFQKLNQDLSGEHLFDRRSGKPLEETREKFNSLQQDVRDVLYAVVDARHLLAGKKQDDESASVTLPPIRISASYFLRPSDPPFTDHNDLCAMGSERDMFLFGLLHYLSTEPTNRLNRCPECRRLFVRVRKRLYCSRKCVNRVNARTWRQTPEGKRKNRARVAAHYEKSQRAKHGAKTRIIRRRKD